MLPADVGSAYMSIDSCVHEMVLQVDVESSLGGSSNLYHIEQHLLFPQLISKNRIQPL